MCKILIILFLIAVVAPAGGLDRAKLAGRQVKVSAIAIGPGGDHAAKLKLAIDHLHVAGKNNVDIACLPEIFAGNKPEPIPGPTTHAIAALAKQYGMYVVCPIIEQAGDEQYNTAVLLDRKGEVAGRYRKVFVFWGENVHCSREGVKVFETDFGRVSILTCFDLNYAELWQECADLDVELVLWPSAYGGGPLLNAYATVHNYYIVPVGWGNLIDMTGKPAEAVERPRDKQTIATFDLDRTLVHFDFNREKIKKLLEKRKGEVALEHKYDMAGWWLLKSVKPGVRVRDLLKQYKIETLREYRARSRKQINEARKQRKKI